MTSLSARVIFLKTNCFFDHTVTLLLFLLFVLSSVSNSNKVWTVYHPGTEIFCLLRVASWQSTKWKETTLPLSSLFATSSIFLSSSCFCCSCYQASLFLAATFWLLCLSEQTNLYCSVGGHFTSHRSWVAGKGRWGILSQVLLRPQSKPLASIQSRAKQGIEGQGTYNQACLKGMVGRELLGSKH